MNIKQAFRSPNVAVMIKSLAARLGVSICPFSFNVRDQVARIGGVGAAEVFAEYVSRMHELQDDHELASFINFYISNWRSSCSQWSQDIFVMYVSKLKKKGLFLEIGGADGFTHSNTLALEKHLDWNGVLVEPDPGHFSLMKKTRSQNHLILGALAPGKADQMVRLRRAGQLSALEGYEGDDFHSRARLSSRSLVNVKSVNLSDILAEKKYDYFSLDVEGAELEIFRGIEWNRVHKPSILTIEYNFRQLDREQLVKLLKAQGYVEYFAHYDWLRRGDIWAALPE